MIPEFYKLLIYTQNYFSPHEQKFNESQLPPVRMRARWKENPKITLSTLIQEKKQAIVKNKEFDSGKRAYLTRIKVTAF